MVSFYPGPSQVYPSVLRYMKDAYASGIMSINHRSEEFVAIYTKAVALLKEKLDIPEKYSVYFISSATECWEIIAQSLIKNNSAHLYNGAFGKKWFEYTKKLKPEVQAFSFDANTELNVSVADFSAAEMVCITQNETSNGTQVSNKIIQHFRQRYPDNLLAIDATSSMGGIYLDFKSADVWFASVQKCFGLPAGMAIMVCSQQAVERARALNENKHYNSLVFLDDMMKVRQTPNTPNVLSIYLLMRVLEDINHIVKINKTITSRYRKWETFFETKSNQLNFLSKNKAVRSHTVLAIEANPLLIDQVKTKAKQEGFLLGDGYGELKPNTFRIANFPALRRSEIARLMDFMYDYI
jgi:phosphoserine aminotransferase